MGLLAIVAIPLLLSTARALPEIRAGQAPPSSPQPGKNHIFFLNQIQIQIQIQNQKSKIKNQNQNQNQK